MKVLFKDGEILVQFYTLPSGYGFKFKDKLCIKITEDFYPNTKYNTYNVSETGLTNFNKDTQVEVVPTSEICVTVSKGRGS